MICICHPVLTLDHWAIGILLSGPGTVTVLRSLRGILAYEKRGVSDLQTVELSKLSQGSTNTVSRAKATIQECCHWVPSIKTRSRFFESFKDTTTI